MSALISAANNRIGAADFFTLLTKRMSEKGDFPAFSHSIQRLDEMINNENHNIAEITSLILSDFTLTQKVIRLANSAMYYGMGGEITTVTQAVAVLGMDAISHIVFRIRFIDTLSNSVPNTREAHAELAKAILAGDIARNIVTKSNLTNGEEAVVCALMHHLGRLMLVFYFPQEWSEIQKISAGIYARQNEATHQVIGVTVDQISQAIARNWRLPGKIASSMASSATFHETSIPGSTDWLRIMANFAGGAASMLIMNSSKEDLADFVSDYCDALLISSDDMAGSIELAQSMAKELVHKTENIMPKGKPEDSRERLAISVYELGRALEQKIDFNKALSMVLESMYASMGFNRVVTFFRDNGAFKAKLGFGDRMPVVLPELSFPETYAANVFHMSVANRSDVFIRDTTSNRAKFSMPAWYTKALPDVGAFILLPMVFNDHVIGLIYADWKKESTGNIDSNELASMSTLRDYLMRALAKKK